jgi:hypothetical protein
VTPETAKVVAGHVEEILRHAPVPLLPALEAVIARAVSVSDPEQARDIALECLKCPLRWPALNPILLIADAAAKNDETLRLLLEARAPVSLVATACQVAKAPDRKDSFPPHGVINLFNLLRRLYTPDQSEIYQGLVAVLKEFDEPEAQNSIERFRAHAKPLFDS